MKSLTNSKLELFITAIFLTVISCGYSTRSLLPPHLKTVAITAVENSTTQPGLAEELSLVLPRVFNSDRNLRVTSLENADLVVSITLTGYSRTAAAYDAEQTISAYEISLAAQVEAQDQVRNEPFFSGTISTRISYEPERKSEEDALSEAIEKLAREITRQIITAW
ncbi:MAG: LPS assembly lipoprotein LptE [candidate division WOR-3 bacterium]